MLPINPEAGAKFDPHQHQAISMIPAEQDPNTVVSVLQKGYLLADRVLRPALVVVGLFVFEPIDGLEEPGEIEAVARRPA